MRCANRPALTSCATGCINCLTLRAGEEEGSGKLGKGFYSLALAHGGFLCVCQDRDSVSFHRGLQGACWFARMQIGRRSSSGKSSSLRTIVSVWREAWSTFATAAVAILGSPWLYTSGDASQHFEASLS